MLSTYRAFLAIIKKFRPENGKTYAIYASTMGTLDIVPTSKDNAFTSVYLPVLWIIIPCAPITTMFAC